MMRPEPGARRALLLAALAAMAAAAGCNPFANGPIGKLLAGPEYEVKVRTENQVYDPSLGTGGASPWTSAASLPSARSVETGVLAEGKIYVVAGGTTDAIRFDPTAGTGGAWQALPPLSEPRAGAVAVACGATVVVVSGRGADGRPVAGLEQIDGSAATPTAWVQVALPFARADMAVVAEGGKVYLFGGIDKDDRASDEGWVYDPIAGTVTPAAGLGAARYGASAFAAAGKIHVIGGKESPGGAILASEDIYDIATDTLASAKRAVPDPWVVPQVTASGDFVVVSQPRSFGFGRTRAVDLYQVSTDTWSQVPYPIQLDMVSFAPNGGRILGFGGFDGDLSKRSVYSLDLGARTWTEVYGMPTKRHAALSITIGGRTYVIGGVEREEKSQDAGSFL
jgi:hypothetical protein